MSQDVRLTVIVTVTHGEGPKLEPDEVADLTRGAIADVIPDTLELESADQEEPSSYIVERWAVDL